MEITLTNVEGVSRKFGIDQEGNTWTEFEVDYLAEQEMGICVECGAELEVGWLCLDGGDEVCQSHIIIAEE